MSTLNIGTNIQITGANQTISGVLHADGIIPPGAIIYTSANFYSGALNPSIPGSGYNKQVGNILTPGYLPCDGSSLRRTVYPELFTAIGTWFGNGTNEFGANTTFALPDLRGEFIRCWDGPVYTSRDPVVSGRVFGSSQAEDFKSHTHPLTVSGADDNNHTGNGSAAANSDAAQNATNATSATGGTETRPRNYAFLALIKY
jgi:microcystin-dependent protein